MKALLLLLFTSSLLCGCSSSHQISFSIPPPSADSSKRGFTVGIYAPDSLKNFVYSSTLSGGLCQGHEFDLHIGSGIIDALNNSLSSVYDTVMILNTPSAKLEDCIIPIIKQVNSNADFSPTTFAVIIKATVAFTLHIQYIHSERKERDDVGDLFPKDITISAESSGKGEDCHNAVIYLKKAGDIAMEALRDSIIMRLVPINK